MLTPPVTVLLLEDTKPVKLVKLLSGIDILLSMMRKPLGLTDNVVGVGMRVNSDDTLKLGVVVAVEDGDTNKLNSGDQATDLQSKAPVARAVQITPLGDVMIRLVPSIDDATNKPTSGAHMTLVHWFASAALAVTHVVPLTDVITRFVPSRDTATKSPNSLDQHTECHWLACVAEAVDHEVALDDTMTLFVPLPATATNNPSSDAQHTDNHSFTSAGVRVVQDAPVTDVITRFAPVRDTATNSPSSGEKQTDLHSLVVTDTPLHVIPSSEYRTSLIGPVPSPTATKRFTGAGAQHISHN